MDEHAVRVARHEAAHASAAFLLGFELIRVERDSRSAGETHFTKRVSGGDISQRAEDLAVVLLAPYLLDTWGTEHDLQEIDGLLRAGPHLLLSRIWERTEKIVDSAAFRRGHDTIWRAMSSTLVLDADEVLELLA
jgi:hypothetical protein